MYRELQRLYNKGSRPCRDYLGFRDIIPMMESQTDILRIRDTQGGC